MLKEFDRSKQKFWISRHRCPWQVYDCQTQEYVRDIDSGIAYAIEEEFLLVETKEELDSLIDVTTKRLALEQEAETARIVFRVPRIDSDSLVS